MKKEFEFPEISIYSFSSEDIITTSPFTEGPGEGGEVPNPFG